MTARARLRVLHVLNELRASGAETMLRDSAAAWAAAEVEVGVLSTGDELGAFAPELRAVGYDVHHLPFQGHPRFLQALRQLLRRERYDVLHLHTERGNFWYGLTGASVRGVGVVRTVHSVFAFEGALRAERRVQRRSLRALGVRTVSIGRTVHDNERDRFANPTTIVPNWVDTARFPVPTTPERTAARGALGLDAAVVLVSVGNCGPSKNHAAILHALAALPDGPDWCYLHAGEEHDDADERRLAGTLGLGDRVRFLGHVADVPRLLRASDLFLMPSTHEGLPIAALEALASGVRCVLADAPGIRDLRATVPEGIVWVEPTVEGVRAGVEQGLELVAAGDDTDRASVHRAVEAGHGVVTGVAGYLAVYRAVTGRG